MFDAVCVGVRKKTDGTIIAKVRVVDTRGEQPKAMFEQEFSGATKPAIKAQIDAVLATLKNAEDDAVLQAQYVGMVLSTI